MSRRRRRADGEGTIYQDKRTGLWYGVLSNGTGPDGKRNRPRTNTGRKTPEEAAEDLLELRELRKRNRLPIPNRTTVTEYVDKWMENAKTVRGREGRGLEENTIAAYQGSLNHLKEAYGTKLLKDLTSTDLENLYLKMRNQGLSVKTRESLHKLIGQVLRAAVNENIIPEDVTKRVNHAPRAEDGGPRPLSISEVHDLLEAAPSLKYRVLFQLAIDAALGRGEVLGLTWNDVDWRNHAVSVRQQVQRRKMEGGITTKRLKTRSRVRHPKFTASTAKALKEWQNHLRSAFGPEFVSRRAFIFAGGDWRNPDPTRPMSPESLHQAFVKAREAAGIYDVTFHDLRDTAATWLAEHNLPPKAAMKRLGHSEIETTLKYYTLAGERSEERAVHVMELLFDTENTDQFTNHYAQNNETPEFVKCHCGAVLRVSQHIL